MFNLLGRALGGAVLTKGARDAIDAGRSKSNPSGGARGGKAAAIAAMQARAKSVVTPERGALIDNAMKVRSAKQVILANLSDEQRAQLVGAAMKRLLNEGKD